MQNSQTKNYHKRKESGSSIMIGEGESDLDHKAFALIGKDHKSR